MGRFPEGTRPPTEHQHRQLHKPEAIFVFGPPAATSRWPLTSLATTGSSAGKVCKRPVSHRMPLLLLIMQLRTSDL